jgi:hypothetical protein
MRSQSFRFTLLACVLALATCLQAQVKKKESEKPTHKELQTQNPLVSEFKFFSANVSGGLAQDHDRKIYRSGNLLRVDFDNGEYRITDLSTLKMWGITGKQCAAFSRPDVSSFPFSAYHDFKAESSVTQEEETVDGHVCKMENLALTPTDGRPLVIKMKLWEAKDLDGFPIRIDIDAGPSGKFTSTYTNVSREAPDPKLFQHPAKCTPGLLQPKKGSAKVLPPAPKEGAATPPKPQP